MSTLEALSSVVELVALAVPLVFGAVSVVAPRRAAAASLAALTLACFFCVGAGLTHDLLAPRVASFGVRVDVVTAAMLLLVSGLGAVVVRYSKSYLQGDPGYARYQRWLLAVLGSVTALVVTNNLGVLALGWTATSLALHQLLTFYPDRTAALVAAHKKFLVSRLADASLTAAVVLVQRCVGSLDFDRIAAWAGAHPALTPSMHAAAVLVVVAVALKSAQLPFHGWLTQVMEAPTPVSALLHAGVVNIGGFVLLRLAPWMSHARPAQWALVSIGLVSALVAALVMTTRVSVKLALAWSTCAQMGFMLVQCGLGLWHLALLHLVAHSLYKSHAFLSAGTAVEAWRVQRLALRTPAPSASRFALTALAVAGSALGAALLAQRTFPGSIDLGPSAMALALVVSLSAVPLIAYAPAGGAPTAISLTRAAAVVGLYVASHAAAAALVPAPAAAANPVAWALVAAGFFALFSLRIVLESRPEGRVAGALHPWLFSGLYLDELFTRATFWAWPPRLPPGPERTRTGVVAVAHVVQA